MVSTRFAPSPTGSLHIGGARTALYNFLFARHTQGEFLLRIEDTDRDRNIEMSQYAQMSDLEWLGINWDKGVMPDGQMQGSESSYRQSERSHIYDNIIDRLLTEGKAFYCFLTDEELDSMRSQAVQNKQPFRVISPYRNENHRDGEKKAQSSDNFTIRLRNDFDKTYQIKDLVRGDIDMSTTMVGDFVLMRSGGMPVYNFSCVVDDHLMEITHVLRGEEHLSNTVRQLMVYESLGWQPPQFGHLSVIVGKNKKKLSKRDDAVSVKDFKDSGYLPEAILNAMVLLGWSDPSGREILSLDNMIESFDIHRLHVSAAMFDREKLLWLNAQYMRAMSAQILYDRLIALIPSSTFVPEFEPQVVYDVIELYKHDAHTLIELKDRLQMVLGDFHIDAESKETLSWDTSKRVIRAWQKMVHNDTEQVKNNFSDIVQKIKTSCDVKGKFLFMPLRIALIGHVHGAELKELIQVMPENVIQARADRCLELVGAN